MNWDIVEGKWNEYKGKAQAQWGKLTNDDLDVVEGRRDELAGDLESRIPSPDVVGQTRECDGQHASDD